MNAQDSGLPNETFCGGTPDDDMTREDHLQAALLNLFRWAEKANQRLTYEQADGYQFGGNPYLNPLFKEVRNLLNLS